MLVLLFGSFLEDENKLVERSPVSQSCWVQIALNPDSFCRRVWGYHSTRISVKFSANVTGSYFSRYLLAES